MPDLELKIEQLTATARREALPNFDGKTATTVLADRVYRSFYYSWLIIKQFRLYVYWPFSINSCACMNSVYQATFSWTGNEATL